MKLYGENISTQELKKRIGDLSQVAGITKFTYSSGKAMNMRGISVKTGSGLNYTVLEDRCLDICNFEYKGIPFAHIAKSGITAPWFYEPLSDGWLRSFNGGLITTCGFTNAGMTCDINGKNYGLHGRASHLPADEVNVFTNIMDEDIELVITGKIREAAMEQENISLFRTIKSMVGGKKVTFIDEFVNDGFKDEPLLLIYHCNIGYPIFSINSTLIADIKKTIPFTEKFPDSINAIDNYNTVEEPDPDIGTQVFFHDLNGEEKVSVAMVNKKLKLGIKITYNKKELPVFSQARVLKPTDYYMVLEPSNCYPLGRLEQEKQFGLDILKPGQKKIVELEFSVIEEDEISKIDEDIFCK